MSDVGAHLRESRTAIADVFRNPNLRRLNLAFAGSVVGDWAYAVALAVYAYEHGGATTVGALGVVRYLSMSLLAPFVSILADKLPRKRVMIASDLLRVVLVLVAALVIQSGGPSIVVYAVSIVQAWVGLAFRPAQAALLPTLAASPSELTAANVSTSTIHSTGFFLGPTIAGFLLAVANVPTVYVFDAVTFGWSAFLVIGLRVPARPAAEPEPGADAETEASDAPASKPGMFDGVGDGYRTILGNRDLRLLVGLYLAQTIVAGASSVYEVAIALDLLHLRESGLGVLNAALGIGGLVGGVVALLLAQRGKLARDFGIGVALWAAPLLLVTAWPTLASAMAAMVLIGLGNSVVDVNAETIIQRLVPDEVMGRVFGALDSAVIAGMAIGAAAMPLLIHTLGLRTGLLVLGSTITGVVVLATGGLRRVDRVALVPDGLALLQGVPMLGVLPDRVIERLARTSKVVTVPKGEVVFREGDEGDRFYVIERGTVDVSIRGEYVRTLEAGGSFGEIALLRDLPRTATVTATSDLVARTIDRRHFIPAVTGHGEASQEADTVVTKLLDVI